MKRLLMLVATLVIVTVSGCAAYSNAPTSGWIYTNAKGPGAVSSDTAMPRTGKATCTSILGLVSEGDCSIQAAKSNGGITRVAQVDTEHRSILGLYATYTTVVKGS